MFIPYEGAFQVKAVEERKTYIFNTYFCSQSSGKLRGSNAYQPVLYQIRLYGDERQQNNSDDSEKGSAEYGKEALQGVLGLSGKNRYLRDIDKISSAILRSYFSFLLGTKSANSDLFKDVCNDVKMKKNK